jgi:putative ABC transport system permease protein
MNHGSDVWLRFLQFICPDHLFEEIAGDLQEKFERDKANGSARRANRRYVWNVVRFFRPGIMLRKKGSSGLIRSRIVQPFKSLLKNNISFQQTNNMVGWVVFSIGPSLFLRQLKM